MRRVRGAAISVLLVLNFLSLSCSKKSTPPTAPPPPDPSCSLSATTLAFGTVTIGSSADRTFTVTNTGGGNLGGTVTESSSEFAIIGTAAYSLGAGQVFTGTLRFSPTSPGAKTLTLATGSTLCGSVTATGTGQLATPLCYVSPTAISFGTVDYAASSYRNFAISNNGGGTLTGSMGGLTTDFDIVDANDIAIPSPTFTLGPGQVQNFQARFHPTTGGAQACTLKVDPPSCSPIILSGTGNLYLSGQCGGTPTSPDTLDFGEVSLGQTVERTVMIRNASSTDASAGGAGEVCPDFSAAFGTSLPPGVTAPRSVFFTPTRVGLQYCAVQFYCEMLGSQRPGPNYYLICRGLGVGGTPVCQVSPTTIDFLQVAVGQTKDLTFQITNTGTGTLSGTAGPSTCNEFTFVGPVNYSLHAGETATITVRYTPTTIGHTTSCPLVPTGAGCSMLTLIGEAVAPSPVCEVTPTTLDFGIVAPGTTKDLSCTIRNIGGAGSNLCETLHSGAPTYFTIVSTATYCLGSGQTQVVTIRFSPDATTTSISTSVGGQWCTIGLTGRTQ